MQPRTKIVATIGPACWDEPVLRALLTSGVSVARINFSHAEHEQTAKTIALIRRIAGEADLNVAILADLQGPRVRVGSLPPAGVPLTQGDSVTLQSGPGEEAGRRETIIPVDYAGLARDVRPGDAILLDEGLIVLTAQRVDVEEGQIVCRVAVGGLLLSHKGLNVPNRYLGVPTITGKDRRDLAFALAAGADMVALSFVRSAEDIEEGRRLIAAETARHIPVVAKIENALAVEKIAEIVAAADVVMVARGDMGVEMPPETLPAIQKRIIAACNRAAKPVITATQMLDSMIRNPRPTRAEATDVANAVLDGTDAIMLSGETATGRYPVESVRTMARIALEAEKLVDYTGWGRTLERDATIPAAGSTPEVATGDDQIAEVLCQAADQITDRLNARAILVLTRTGASARRIARYRPRSKLIAATVDEDTLRALAVCWGVHALRLGEYSGPLSTMASAEEAALKQGLITQGDLLVLLGGLGPGAGPQGNLLKVRVAGAS